MGQVSKGQRQGKAVKPRRGRGEGGVWKRADGRWQARLELGYADGKRKHKDTYGRTRAEVVAKLRRLHQAVENGQPLIDERRRLGEYLEVWLEEVVRGKAPQTYRGYANNVRRHIVPTIGHIRLAKLGAADVQSLLNAKRDEGLSPRSIQYIHAVLRASLANAERWGLVNRNVAKLVTPVKVPHVEQTPFSIEEAGVLLAAAEGNRLEAYVSVALSLGLRPGESRALKWEDIDLEDGSLSVRRAVSSQAASLDFHDPKGRSRRTLPLPDGQRRALREHRRRQAEERLAAGGAWADTGLVFTDEIGGPLSHWHLTRVFNKLQERAGVTHHRLYDARHTAATLLLAAGVHPRVVMEILGHSSYRLTMDTYGHAVPQAVSEGAAALDRALSASSAVVRQIVRQPDSKSELKVTQ